jgi:peptide/nickel transport system substrate-binding protein
MPRCTGKAHLASTALALATVLALTACARKGGCSGDYCGTLVFASVGEPETLLPPVAQSTSARDVSDQVFLKLADLGMLTNTIGDEDFTPLLADHWEWEGPLTLAFHIDPRARWHDGQPVSAADVVFTYDAYNDPRVGSPSRTSLRWISAVTLRDSLTAIFRFRRRYPEMFYDAVYHMRILPGHLLRNVPRARWQTAAFGRAPVGDGPYRFAAWKAGESLELVADSTFFLGRPHIRRLIWRFTPDLQVAVSQLVAGEADALEVLVSPDNIQRVKGAPHLATYPYKGSGYAYLGFNLAANGDSTKPHPLFADRDIRRALAMATDRERLVKSVFGENAKVPPGPMSQLLWIWDPEIRELPYDTAQAGRLLTARGWIDSDGDGVRDREGATLSFRLLVPTSSAVRRAYARLLQEQFRRIGVEVRIDEVEFSVFMQREQAGQFDAVLQTWNTDPTPSSGISQTWTRGGIGQSNYLRYASVPFDQLVDQASTTFDRREARRSWRAAMELINQDAPAIFLFAVQNVAAIHRRVENVAIRPDSWWALVRTWRIPPGQLIDRDRVEH